MIDFAFERMDYKCRRIRWTRRPACLKQYARRPRAAAAAAAVVVAVVVVAAPAATRSRFLSTLWPTSLPDCAAPDGPRMPHYPSIRNPNRSSSLPIPASAGRSFCERRRSASGRHPTPPTRALGTVLHLHHNHWRYSPMSSYAVSSTCPLSSNLIQHPIINLNRLPIHRFVNIYSIDIYSTRRFQLLGWKLSPVVFYL